MNNEKKKRYIMLKNKNREYAKKQYFIDRMYGSNNRI